MKILKVVIYVIAGQMTLMAGGLFGERIYFIGNSVTDTVNYVGFAELAGARGYSQPWGRQMIPGAPLQWLWDHPSDGFAQAPYGYPGQALPGFEWDVLSLQPFDRPLESDVGYIERYLQLLYGGSGDAAPTVQQLSNRGGTRVMVYARWPRQDDPARAGGPRDYDTLWLRQYPEGGANANESAEFFKELTAALRARAVNGVALAERVFMVPVGHVMYELNQQMKAGQMPGFSNIFDLYADGIHLTSVGAYAVACTYFGAVYRESPVGLPVPSGYGSIDPVIALRIQETAWNVLQTQVLSGVPSSGNLILTTLAVPPAYRGSPYTTTMLAVGGVGTRTFALSAGSLPAGLSLSAQGQLSGIPTTAGEFNFSVTVSDSSTPEALQAVRAFSLRVDVDSIPEILTAAELPGVGRGGRYDLTLRAQGGNGVLRWALIAGELPAGLILGEGGVLYGSVLTEGTFQFTLQVADSDVPADRDSREFTLRVGPPAEQTIVVAKALSPVRIDGEMLESHWSLAHRITEVQQGVPDNSADFAMLWDANHLYVAVRVMDDYLSLGTGSGNQQDAIEVYIDAHNDKQAEFNVQHRQYRLTLDGRLVERGGRTNGVQHAMLLIEGGYQVELAIPWTNLGIVAIADQTVIGIDVANSDADGLGIRQNFTSFAGVTADDPRPAQFGSAILLAQGVTGTGGEAPQPAGEQPLAYEPFDYAPGHLHTLGNLNPTGFSGSWSVQNSNVNPGGFSVSGEESLSYGGLATAGSNMIGGTSYLHAGRALDVSGAFAEWRREGTNTLGKPGTSLWISYLARPLIARADIKFSLDNAPETATDNLGIVRVRQQNGHWELSLMNGAQVSPTTVPVVAASTYLIVLRIEFGSTNRVDVFINPILSPTPPESPSATAITADPAFSLHEFQLYPGPAPGDGQFDEIRFGRTWQSVTPLPPAAVAPVVFMPPGQPFAGSLAVALSTASENANIHYTTDGTAPTTASPTYSAPLTVADSTTVRAIAVVDDRASVAAATRFEQVSPYTYWASRQQWLSPAAADRLPGADPDLDGLPNLLEFALLKDPTVPDSLPLQLQIIGDQLALSYLRGREQINYTVEVSTDLVHWSSTGVDNDRTTPVGEMATATIQAQPPVFIRLTIDQ